MLSVARMPFVPVVFGEETCAYLSCPPRVCYAILSKRFLALFSCAELTIWLVLTPLLLRYFD